MDEQRDDWINEHVERVLNALDGFLDPLDDDDYREALHRVKYQVDALVESVSS